MRTTYTFCDLCGRADTGTATVQVQNRVLDVCLGETGCVKKSLEEIVATFEKPPGFSEPPRSMIPAAPSTSPPPPARRKPRVTGTISDASVVATSATPTETAAPVPPHPPGPPVEVTPPMAPETLSLALSDDADDDS